MRVFPVLREIRAGDAIGRKRLEAANTSGGQSESPSPVRPSDIGGRASRWQIKCIGRDALCGSMGVVSIMLLMFESSTTGLATQETRTSLLTSTRSAALLPTLGRIARIRLFVEFISSPTRFRDSSPAPLEASIAPMFLHRGLDGIPELRSEPPRDSIQFFLIQTVHWRKTTPRLLILTSEAAEFRVNGEPSPGVRLLGEKDQFRVDDEFLFHVTLWNPSRVGRVPSGADQRQCPVCLGDFAAGATACYTCDCGAVLHCEENPSGLQCAQATGECPACQAPIRTAAGYRWMPDSLDEDE